MLVSLADMAAVSLICDSIVAAALSIISADSFSDKVHPAVSWRHVMSSTCSAKICLSFSDIGWQGWGEPQVGASPTS